jgi:hypothetical protein
VVKRKLAGGIAYQHASVSLFYHFMRHLAGISCGGHGEGRTTARQTTGGWGLSDGRKLKADGWQPETAGRRAKKASPSN